MSDSKIRNRVWPEWELDGKPLGRGSYGTVYRAVRRDHNVESFAAIKVISIPQHESEVETLRSEGLPESATKRYLQEVVNDFVREIQLMESFKGVQNIVSVEDYKVVEKEDTLGWDIYIRMELLTPFSSLMSDKPLPQEEVIKLGIDICTALELCAERNVIHRDIKPQNIFINQFGHYKLGDFGIARKLENITGGLSQKGSPNYMAPEVARSAQYDATVDLYSLGLVLYQLMNRNRLPFLDTEHQRINPNARTVAVNRRLAGEPLPAPCDASPALAELILCACNPNPGKRFPSATAMKRALLNVANDLDAGQSNALDPTKTLFHPKQTLDPNRTTSVRRAPQETNPAQIPVATFGEKKKSKPAAFLAAVFALLLLVGGGAFAATRLIQTDGADAGHSEKPAIRETVAEASRPGGSEVADSDSDEEQIANAMQEAEALAAEGNYEDALKRIETALAAYPKSNELQAQKAKLTDELEKQRELLADGDDDPDIGETLGTEEVFSDTQKMTGESEVFVPVISMSAITNISASSYLVEEQYRFSHDPSNVIDGTLSKAWVENAPGQGSGESITLQFDGTYQVSGFLMNAGYQKNSDIYYKNSRPAKLSVSFSDGTYLDVVLKDFFGQQSVTFPSFVATSSVTFTILSVFPGEKYQDTAISEIKLF